MDRPSILFCAASLLLTLVVCFVLYPFAAIPEAQLRASQKTTPAYEMGEVDLGEFGRVPVEELVDYYLENPPPKATGAEVAERRVRFQGC